MDSVILGRGGLISKTWKYDKVAKEGHYETKPLTFDMLTVTAAWGRALEIEEGVTLLDLVTVLKQGDLVDLDILERLANSNIVPYLTGSTENVVLEKDDYENPLVAIEVYKYFEVDDYDRELPHPTMEHHASCHGISRDNGKNPDGTDSGCNSWAIEFTEWSKLLPLELRLNKKGTLCETKWHDCEPHQVIQNMPDFVSHRKPDPHENRDVLVEFTLGEFLSALFNEICFFGSPARRDIEKASLLSARDECEEMLEKEKEEGT